MIKKEKQNEKYEYEERDRKGLLAIGMEAYRSIWRKEAEICTVEDERRFIELGRSILGNKLGQWVKRKKIYKE